MGTLELVRDRGTGDLYLRDDEGAGRASLHSLEGESFADWEGGDPLTLEVVPGVPSRAYDPAAPATFGAARLVLLDDGRAAGLPVDDFLDT